MGRYVTVNLDIDLDDIDTEQLIEELKLRGFDPHIPYNSHQLIESIYEKYILGHDYDKELKELFYCVVGRIA